MAPNAGDPVSTCRQSLEVSAAKSAKASFSWGDTFPEQFDSQEDSNKFMQRCLLLAMSQMLYSRGLLPFSSFKKRVVTDIVRCQVPAPDDPIGRRLLEKLKGAIEALKHRYLNELIVVVSTNDNNHDEAVEVFTWTVRYNDENNCYLFLSNDRGDALAKIQYKGPEHVKEQTRLLLLRIRKLCRDVLAPLPSDAFPTFRITYTNDTPKGYQAPGFFRSPTLYDLHMDARSVDVGGVATGKHKILLSVDSIYIDDEIAARNAIASADDLASEISSNRSDTSFVDDSINNNHSVFEEPRFVPMEERHMPVKKAVEAKKGLRKSPGEIVQKVSPGVNSQKKTKKFSQPTEAAKKSPGYSGKMNENTPTSSPPRNH